MTISKKIEQHLEKSSWIRRMFEEGNALKKKLGQENVYDFSLGNPIMEPPQLFLQSLKEVAGDQTPGMHRYMPNAGFPETRDYVAETLSEESGAPLTSDHIIMTCGAAAGINVILKTILNPGEEVIIFSPFFAEYIFYIDNAGGRIYKPKGPIAKNSSACNLFPLSALWRHRYKSYSLPGYGQVFGMGINNDTLSIKF